MNSQTLPRILLCASADSKADDVRRVLEQAQFHVEVHALGGADPHDLNSYQAVVMHAGSISTECLAFWNRFHSKVQDSYQPALFISADSTTKARLASLENGADAFLARPFDAAELLAQVRALLRSKERHDRLAEKAAEVHRINKRLQQAYHQIDEELELAKHIQQSFLPQQLPDLPQVRFAVHYQPCGRVGGDFYDIFRLDEQHVGFYVADAMGHGVPASLLTIFVKTGVRAKEIFGKQYRLVPPDELLQRLNRDLIAQQLSNAPFISMVYALYNYRDGKLLLSRAGHPHPIYLPRHGEAQIWPVEGGLLGVFDTHYMVRTEQLQPGDRLLLYTDGMDAAVLNDAATGVKGLVEFVAEHRDSPIDVLVRQLALRLFTNARQTDDLTVLGLEVAADLRVDDRCYQGPK